MSNAPTSKRGKKKKNKKHPNTHEVLTVFLSLYAELDIIVILYSLRSIIHMLTLDVGLQKPAHHTVINSSQRVVQKYRKTRENVSQLTTIFPLKSFGMVPSTHVPFILFSTLSRSWNGDTSQLPFSSRRYKREYFYIVFKPLKLTTLHSSWTSCCMKLSNVSHLTNTHTWVSPKAAQNSSRSTETCMRFMCAIKFLRHQTSSFLPSTSLMLKLSFIYTT